MFEILREDALERLTREHLRTFQRSGQGLAVVLVMEGIRQGYWHQDGYLETRHDGEAACPRLFLSLRAAERRRCLLEGDYAREAPHRVDAIIDAGDRIFHLAWWMQDEEVTDAAE